MILPLLAGWVVILSQQSTPLEQVEQKYRFAFKELPGNLVTEAGLRPQPPAAAVTDLSQVGLRSTALGLGLVFEREAGVSIFRLPSPDETASREGTVISALGQLSDAQLEQIFKTGLHLEDVPADIRQSLVSAISTSPAVASKLAHSGGRAVVKLSIITMVEYADATGTKRQAPLNTIGNRIPQQVIAAAEERAKSSKTGATTPEKLTFDSDTGPLDFGEGRLIKISEAMTRAEASFGTGYTVDRRLAADYLFVRGKFSKKGFETAVGRLTRASPLAPILGDRRNRLLDFLKTRLAPFASGVPYKLVPDLDTLLTTPKFSAGEFMALGLEASEFASFFKVPRNGTLQLYPMLDISVNGGTHDTNYVLGFPIRH